MMTTEANKQIRSELRALGYGPKDISVRMTPGGSIRVEIKRPGISKSVVEKIANKHSHVRFDEASGEILAGGNTFVFVNFARGTHAAQAAEILPQLPIEPNRCTRIAGTNCLVGLDQHGRRFTIWNSIEGHSRFVAESFGREECATLVAEHADA